MQVLVILLLVGFVHALDEPYAYQTWQNYPVGSNFYNQQSQGGQVAQGSMQQQPRQGMPNMMQMQENRATRIQTPAPTTTTTTTTTTEPPTTASQATCGGYRNAGDYCAEAQPTQMFYYDRNTDVCQPFLYRGCGGNGNRFASKAECQAACAGAGDDRVEAVVSPLLDACSAKYEVGALNVTRCSSAADCSSGFDCKNRYCCPSSSYLCSLQYSSGNFVEGGGDYSDRYYYTEQYGTCMRFSYYGHGGNVNNFKNFNLCMSVCGQPRGQSWPPSMSKLLA